MYIVHAHMAFTSREKDDRGCGIDFLVGGQLIMAQMIRKQVYIEPIQDEIIKQRARMLGITEAEVIRRAIDKQMALLSSGIRDLDAWEQEKAFIARRISGGPSPGGRRFRREDAYEERLNRYGR
jgi:hypothetical protein